MKTHFRNFAFVTALVAFLVVQNSAFAQNPFSFNQTSTNGDVVMTWNKNTPESEMKDDIKALSDLGITIKYSGVKRNTAKEITAIKVEYSDRKGNKGKMELENITAIAPIKFFKQGETLGFGEPTNGTDVFGGNSMLNGFAGAEEMLKQFQFNGTDGNSKSFNFSFPNDGGSMGKIKSQIRIQKDGKKPLVIEDGEVIEGGDDYTLEEIEKIKSENKIDNSGVFGDSFENKEFDFTSPNGLENFKKQFEKMNSTLGDSKLDKETETTKEELQKAKEEMLKAKEELEKARKELEKSRTNTKIKKA